LPDVIILMAWRRNDTTNPEDKTNRNCKLKLCYGSVEGLAALGTWLRNATVIVLSHLVNSV
jgi:hypothetical protein